MNASETIESTETIEAVANSLREDVARIAYEEGRVVGTAGHAKAERILEGRLREIGCRPYKGDGMRLPYGTAFPSFVNLAGVIPGKSPDKAPLLVGAHYDSVIQAPCADDNAAAVAIALQAGKAAAERGGLDRDLIVAIFDAEEPPHFHSDSMGSRNFYKELDGRGVHAALVMDLVGHDVSLDAGWFGGGGASGLPSQPPGSPGGGALDLKGLLAITGSESHPEMAGILEGCAHPPDLKILPLLNHYVGDMSDHEVFRKKGVPYFFLSCGRWEHYHRRTDTPDRLNYAKMARIGQLVSSLLEGLDGAELAPSSERPDTGEFEARYLESALGPALGGLLRSHLGIETIRTRDDVTKTVGLIMRTGI